MPRTVKPWSSDNPDAMPPPRVRLRIFVAHDGICALTGRQITPQDRWCLDHRVALCNGGANEEGNLVPVLEEAHKAKTADDVAEKSKVNARAKSHLGIRDGVTALAGRDRETRSRAADARRADRTPAGKPPVPGPRSLFREEVG